MEKHFSIIGGFFLRTLLLLIPMLALWYWAREWVVAPPAWLAGKALQFQFPSWVLGIEREGLHHVLLTNLKVVTPNRQVGELTPEIRALSYCYGSALLPALLLGGQARKLWSIEVRYELPHSGPFAYQGVLCLTLGGVEFQRPINFDDGRDLAVDLAETHALTETLDHQLADDAARTQMLGRADAFLKTALGL